MFSALRCLPEGFTEQMEELTGDHAATCTWPLLLTWGCGSTVESSFWGLGWWGGRASCATGLLLWREQSSQLGSISASQSCPVHARGLGLPQTALGVQLLLGEMQVERSITHRLLCYPHAAHGSHVVIQAAQAARELCRGRRPELDSCITGWCLAQCIK